MATNEFFTAYQYQPLQEFVDAELREIFQDTSTHAEFFEFDDVPY
jgi:hypothetical protein